jgi:hypothetical protein
MAIPPGLVDSLALDVRDTGKTVSDAHQFVLQRKDTQERYYQPVWVFVDSVRHTREAFDQNCQAALAVIREETAALQAMARETEAAERELMALLDALPPPDAPGDSGGAIAALRALWFAFPLALFAILSLAAPSPGSVPAQ